MFCSLAVLDPRVGRTMDILSPFIPVLCHSDWLFHGESYPRLDLVHPGRAWPSSPVFSLLSMKPAESFSVLSSQRRQDVFLHSFWVSSFHSRMLLQATLALSKPPMDGEFLPEGSVLDLESVRISLIYGRLSQLLPSYYYTPSCCRHASISCRRRTRATRYLALPMLTFGKVTSKNVIRYDTIRDAILTCARKPT